MIIRTHWLMICSGLWLVFLGLMEITVAESPGEFDCACCVHPDGQQLQTLVQRDRILSGSSVRKASVIDPDVRMLVIRIDFSDMPGAPHDVSGEIDTRRIVDAGANVGDFIDQVSYGQVSFALDSEDVTPVLRLPETAEHYAASPLLISLMPAAYRAAEDAGYDPLNYRFIAILFSSLAEVPGNQVRYRGWAYVGGATSWYNGTFESGIVAHEVGHSLGLQHSNRWQPADSSNPIDPKGTSIEYGDHFDIMGNSSMDESRSNHFNPAHLHQLSWLPTSAIRTVRSSGLFLLHRFDSRDADLERLMAIEVPIDETRSYWINYRYKHARLRDGVTVVRSEGSSQRTHLLDLVPGGTNPQDVALTTGRSFADPELGMVLTVGSPRSSGDNAHIEVALSFTNETQVVPAIVSMRNASHFVQENAGRASLTLMRDRSNGESAHVQWNTIVETASAEDFQMASGQVNWGPDDTEDKIIEIAILPDDLDEAHETFSVKLRAPIGALLGADTAKVTIINVNPSETEDTTDEGSDDPVVEDPPSEPEDPSNSTNSPDGVDDEQPDLDPGNNESDNSEDPPVTTDPSDTDDPPVTAEPQVTDDPPVTTDPPATDDPPVTADPPATDDPPVTADPPATDDPPVTADPPPPPSTDVPGTRPGTTTNADTPGPGATDTEDPPASDETDLPDNSGNDDDTATPPVSEGGDLPSRPSGGSSQPNIPNTDESTNDTPSGSTSSDTSNVIWDLASHADGRLLVGGHFSELQSTPAQGFGVIHSNGEVSSLGQGTNIRIHSVVALTDGRSLLGGTWFGPDNDPRGFLKRLSADGTLDTSFQTFSDIDASVHRIAIQQDQSIIVVGEFQSIGGHSSPGVAKIQADGQIDRGFTSSLEFGTHLIDVVSLPEGPMIVAGGLPGEAHKVSILDAQGTLLKVLGSVDTVTRIVLQPDGQLIVGGRFDKFAGQDTPNLVRLSLDGVIDQSHLQNLGTGVEGTVHDLFIQPNGRLVVLGDFDRLGGRDRSGVGRLLFDGQLDDWDSGLSNEPGSQVGTSVALTDAGQLMLALTNAEQSEIRIASQTAGLTDQYLPGWPSFAIPELSVAPGSPVNIPFARVFGNDGKVTLGYSVQRLDEEGLPTGSEILSGEISWEDNDVASKTVLWHAPVGTDSWDQIGWYLTSVTDGVRLGRHQRLIVHRKTSTTRELWRFKQFGESVSELNAFSHEVDFDQDGVSNLLEYALGRSPLETGGDNGPRALPTIGVAIANGEPRLYIDLDLPTPTRDDLIYEVCTSDGEANESTIARKVGHHAWTDSGSGAAMIEQAQAPTLKDSRQRLRIIDTARLGSTERRFLFLRVILN